MGIIQNAINQTMSSAFALGIGASQAPYVQEARKQSKGLKEAGRLEGALGTARSNQAIREIKPDITQAPPISKKIDEKLAELEEGKNPKLQQEINKRVSTEAETYIKRVKGYFDEERNLSKEYNQLMASLGKPDRLSIGDIDKREQELAKTITDSLRKSYSTREGIENTNRLRREWAEAQKAQKEALNNG